MSKLFRWLFLYCSVVVPVGCSSTDEAPEIPTDITKGRRTVIMYVSAENSLGAKDFQRKDSIEIVNGRHYIDDNDRLLVYMDDASHPRMYRYTKHRKTPEVIRRWDKDLDSSSPQTLQEVLTWCRNTYPSEEYGLVMWSHSDGWLPSTNKSVPADPSSPYHTYSFGIDVGEGGDLWNDADKNGKVGTQMDITDMATAIQRSGIHFKYIFFDSCLMQTLESGFALRNTTDFIIAAPMTIPGCGAQYTHMLKKGLFTDAEYDIVDTYATDAIEGFDVLDNDNGYYDYGLVISCIRTDRLKRLAEVTRTLLPKSEAYEGKSVNLKDVLNYQAYHWLYFYRPHHFDAQEAMKKMLNEEDYRTYKQALDDVVVSKGATKEFWIGPSNSAMQQVDLNNYSGVAAFIPQAIYTRNAGECDFGDLNKEFRKTEWYKAAGWNNTGW